MQAKLWKLGHDKQKSEWLDNTVPFDEQPKKSLKHATPRLGTSATDDEHAKRQQLQQHRLAAYKKLSKPAGELEDPELGGTSSSPFEQTLQSVSRPMTTTGISRTIPMLHSSQLRTSMPMQQSLYATSPSPFSSLNSFPPDTITSKSKGNFIFQSKTPVYAKQKTLSKTPTPASKAAVLLSPLTIVKQQQQQRSPQQTVTSTGSQTKKQVYPKLQLK